MTVHPKRYAVIGSPIAHSLSPVMQQAAFDALKINATYEALEASQAQARSIMARLRRHGYSGWNVTTPLKEAVLPFVDRVSDEGAEARALNVVRAESDGSLSGHNTDGAGFVRALRELWQWEPRGASVLILGSGPAARAIGAALRHARVDRLSCWSRNAVRAREIGSADLRAMDLVVSALPPDARVPDEIAAVAAKQTIVFDLNYGRAESPVARMSGSRRSNGLPLLLYQGAFTLEWWTGETAPLSAMRAAIEEEARRRNLFL